MGGIIAAWCYSRLWGVCYRSDLLPSFLSGWRQRRSSAYPAEPDET